ncbi:MAG: iron ABC transporter permease [Planctomycetes bacterium]|nr:iron ABC transporter permease [Planctomycetota bacterium]
MKIPLLLLVSLAIIVVAPFIGGELPEESASFIIWELRVPRVLVAALVGGCLSLVGACYQTIFHNPLAAPSTVGTTAGAVLGVLVALVVLPASWLASSGLPLHAVAAFVGAMLVSLLVAAIARNTNARVNDVLLAGIAVSLAAGALSAGLQYSADESRTYAAVQWTLGYLPQVGYRGVLLLSCFVLPVSVVLLMQTRSLEALLGGEERASTQGVNVAAVRSLVIIVGALGVAAGVAWCGPIAFVGLIVPHIARIWTGVQRRKLLPLSLIFGAAFLVACDTLARLIIPGRELPVGVLTASLGAPLLVYLVARRSK